MSDPARTGPRPGGPTTDVPKRTASPATPRPAGGASDVAAVDGDDTAQHEDGRHARRDRNKYAVVDAYLELVREGNPRPSIAEVADRSGVSHRSVFRYFSDKNELARTAIERQLAVAGPLVPLTVGPGAALAERIDRFVERRLELFAVVAPAARLSRSLAALQPVLAQGIRTNRAFLRSQIRHLFRAELDMLSADERAHTLSALDALCSLESVDLMRLDQELSPAETVATLRWTIGKLLAP
jgi:AcrR family transcriptional regulator